MNIMIKQFIILLFGLFILASCKTAQQPVISVPINYKERIVERLVPVESPADSTNVLALFECNNLNQVILKQLNEVKSKNMQSQFSFEKGQLKYNAKTDRDTDYIPAKDSIVYREVPVKVNVPVEVNKLTWWQSTEIKAGRILFFIVLAFGLYTLLKWKLKF